MSSSVTSTATIVRGNIVTPSEIIYGGWILVKGEEIVRVERGDVPLPDEFKNSKPTTTAELFLKPCKEGEKEQDEKKVNNSTPAAASPTIINNSPSSSSTRGFEIIDAPFVVPGFVDIHNHGLGGVEEVCDHWLVPEFSQKELCRTGTLTVLASLILAKNNAKRTNDLITQVRSRCGKFFDGCCVIEGIHCEGPIIADCGGLPAQDTTISLDKFKMLVDSMGTDLKVMTIAPSLDATFDPPFARIKYLLERGVRPSLGHDRKADERAIVGALSLAPPSKEFGPMHTTHYCNVMSWSHRDVSLVNYINCNRFPRISKYASCVPPTTEAIMDLVHVHGLTLQGLLSARAPTDVAVISDCISSYEPGKRLKYNGRNIMVRAEGGCYLCDELGRPTLTLAGSSVTIADQFFTLVSVFGVDIVSACRMTATTPATIARVDNKTGSIEVGKKANLLLLDGTMGRIEQRMVYGRWIEGYEPYRMLKPVLSNL